MPATYLRVELSPEDHQMMLAAAAERGMTLRDFLVEAALSKVSELVASRRLMSSFQTGRTKEHLHGTQQS